MRRVQQQRTVMLWPASMVWSTWPSVRLLDDRLIPGITWYSRICADTCTLHPLQSNTGKLCYGHHGSAACNEPESRTTPAHTTGGMCTRMGCFPASLASCMSRPGPSCQSHIIFTLLALPMWKGPPEQKGGSLDVYTWASMSVWVSRAGTLELSCCARTSKALLMGTKTVILAVGSLSLVSRPVTCTVSVGGLEIMPIV